MRELNDFGVINLLEAMLSQTRKDIIEGNEENFEDAKDFMNSQWYNDLTGFQGETQLMELLEERKLYEIKRSTKSK